MSNPQNETLLYQIALSLIPKIGPATYRNIIAYSGSAISFFNLSPGRAAKIPRIGAKLAEISKNKLKYLREAEEILTDCTKKNIKVITLQDPDFPSRLKSLEDSPLILFVKGTVLTNPARSVGIVGTRKASEYGKTITRKIIEDLIPYQPTIISGLAYGIDIEAHKAALQFGLPTIGILGSSVDNIYPSIHKNTAMSMLENGGLMSEFKPGSEMHPGNFPKRNRIISGLSDALIVVEAAKKGGALITAEIAYSYNKEVFAVPGNLQSIYSEGCNNLIRSMKASIFTGVKDLEEALSWSKENPLESRVTKIQSWESFPLEEQQILGLLQQRNEMEIDQISFQLDMSISILASKLLVLEFEGIIKSLPGKKYRLLL